MSCRASRTTQSFNPSKPFSSLTMPRFSPLAPPIPHSPHSFPLKDPPRLSHQTFSPSIQVKPPGFFQNVLHGFGLGTGVEFAKKLFSSEKSKTLEISPPPPPPPHGHFPPPPENVSRTSCSFFEKEYYRCIEESKDIHSCISKEKEYNQCMSSTR
jgi:hypothetical protein